MTTGREETSEDGRVERGWWRNNIVWVPPFSLEWWLSVVMATAGG